MGTVLNKQKFLAKIGAVWSGGIRKLIPLIIKCEFSTFQACLLNNIFSCMLKSLSSAKTTLKKIKGWIFFSIVKYVSSVSSYKAGLHEFGEYTWPLD